MRIIIAGSRTITDQNEIFKAIELGLEMLAPQDVISILSGCARGVDCVAIEFAEQNNIKYFLFPADWSRFGKSAGFRRNKLMADHADALIAIWDGKSKGTLHMINIAKTKNLQVYIYQTHDQNK